MVNITKLKKYSEDLIGYGYDYSINKNNSKPYKYIIYLVVNKNNNLNFIKYREGSTTYSKTRDNIVEYLRALPIKYWLNYKYIIRQRNKIKKCKVLVDHK